MANLEDEVGKIISGKSDRELERLAYEHLWIAFLFAPTHDLEIAIDRIAGGYVRGDMAAKIELMKSAQAKLVAYEAIAKAGGK